MTREFRLQWARFIILLLASTCSLMLHEKVEAREYKPREVRVSQADRILMESLKRGDIDQFTMALGEGADPTAFFENSGKGWVYCAATEIGRETFLQRIVDRGFDANYLQEGISLSNSTPLNCAIWYDNFFAVELLVNAGADPAMRPCRNCIKRMPRSALSRAITLVRFDMAFWLFDKARYSNAQIETVIRQLEVLPLPKKAAENPDRLKLVELLREKGFEVTPWMHADSKTENR